MAKSTRKSNPSSSKTVQSSTPVATDVPVASASPAPVVETVVVSPTPVVVVESVSQPQVVQVVDSNVVTPQSNVVENSTNGFQSSTAPGFQGRYENILNRIKLTQSLLREINSDMLILNRELHRLSKPIQKKKGFKKSDNSRSGITQEVGVSSELEKFLGLNPGSKISRTSVTRAVTEYIKNHNLQNPANRRHIILDGTLSKLLNPPSNEQVTYFNLQKFLKVHYVGSASAQAAAESSVVASS